MGTTITDIASQVPTEAAAYEFFESLRWPDGAICPHCDSIDVTYLAPANGVSRKTRTGAMSERRVRQCCACRKQFSVITGTAFQGTKVALRKWALVFFEMASSKNGVAAREIQRKYGITCKSAWFMLHRIREAMKADPIVSRMSNTTKVADEAYIGGHRRYGQEQARRQAKPQVWASHRQGHSLHMGLLRRRGVGSAAP